MPRIIVSRLVPRKYCINIFGTLWTRNKSAVDKFVINHELIHTTQMRELLYVPFYILYVIEWLVRLLLYRNHFRAYINISFEREAYAHGHDLNYLKSRRHYSFLKYLRRPTVQ